MHIEVCTLKSDSGLYIMRFSCIWDLGYEHPYQHFFIEKVGMTQNNCVFLGH
jgi:hypothetical protein